MFIFLSILINIALICGLGYVSYMYINQKKILEELRKTTLTTKENNIIKDILDCSNRKGIFSIEKSSQNIIGALQNYYNLDYCTILRFGKDEDKLKIVATNAHITNMQDIEDYCNVLYKETNGKPKISYDKLNLNYFSASERNIRYSYFIPLNTNSGDVGVLYIENREDYKENHFELEFFNIVIKNISVAFENSLLLDEKQSLSAFRSFN